jgi:phospholipid N-methyltransferase
VLEGNALHVSRHLADAGVHRIDLMISGLALPSLDAQTRQAVLDSFRTLAAPGAWFSQLTVMPLVFLRFYRRLFREVRFQWALWNAPPAAALFKPRQIHSDKRENNDERT